MSRKRDIRRDFGIDDFPYGYSWLNLRVTAKPTYLHNAPFIGKVLKANTRSNSQLG
jgi:hypothetical protein